MPFQGESQNCQQSSMRLGTRERFDYFEQYILFDIDGVVRGWSSKNDRSINKHEYSLTVIETGI